MSKISWDKNAVLQFSKAIRYIRKDSNQNADKVKWEILEAIDVLLITPEKYAPDKYKKNNIGSYRAFELHRFRISYLIKDEEIIITRFRHTSMKPKKY